MHATEADLRGLAKSLAGTVVLPDDAEYSSLRKPVLGQLAELLPQAVVRVANPADVAEALAFARTRAMPFALRSGAHSFADFCCTDGLLIDLGQMDDITLDGDVVTVEPGARISGLGERLAQHGRVTPCGWCPSVAVGGSVLGGGYGMLSRAYGLGCDHLLAAQVVLADGRVLWVDQDREPELFWALRGAGAGNFGVVTAMRLRTYPAPRVATFVHHWPWSQAARVVDAWQRWAPQAPDEVNAELVLSTMFMPGSQPRVVLFGAVAGASASSARPVLEEFLDRVGPGEELEEVAEVSIGAINRRPTYAGMPMPPMVEPGPPPGVRPRLRVVKSEFFAEPIPMAGIEALLDSLVAGWARPQYRELEFVPWAGAFQRVDPAATAFVHRRPAFMIGHHGMVFAAASDAERETVQQWVRRSWQTVHPYASGAVYPNYPDRDLTDWGRAYYGANLERLRQVKARYDPAGFFRFPHAVSPA